MNGNASPNAELFPKRMRTSIYMHDSQRECGCPTQKNTKLAGFQGRQPENSYQAVYSCQQAYPIAVFLWRVPYNQLLHVACMLLSQILRTITLLMVSYRLFQDEIGIHPNKMHQWISIRWSCFACIAFQEAGRVSQAPVCC